jgi:hypothetical protein
MQELMKNFDSIPDEMKMEVINKMMEKMDGPRKSQNLEARKKLAASTTAPQRGNSTLKSERPLSLKQVHNMSWDELVRS